MIFFLCFICSFFFCLRFFGSLFPFPKQRLFVVCVFIFFFRARWGGFGDGRGFGWILKLIGCSHPSLLTSPITTLMCNLTPPPSLSAAFPSSSSPSSGVRLLQGHFFLDQNIAMHA